MSDLEPLFKHLTELPSSVSMALSIISALIAGWMYIKKVNIDEKTSNSSIQKIQITSLLEQIEMLSTDLTLARQQIRQLHEQNVQLMVELREANTRITAMESALDRKKFGRRKYDNNEDLPVVDPIEPESPESGFGEIK